jgi:hypothetical protein
MIYRKRYYWLIPALLLLLIASLPIALRFPRPDRKSYKTQLFDGVTYARQVRATPMRQRPVANHLGVFILPDGTVLPTQSNSPRDRAPATPPAPG